MAKVRMTRTGISEAYYAEEATVPYWESRGWVVDPDGEPGPDPTDFVTEAELAAALAGVELPAGAVVIPDGTAAAVGQVPAVSRVDPLEFDLTEAVAGVVPFSRYVPDTTGATSAAAKLQQALTELPDGWALDLGPAAYRYLIDSAVTVSGKTVSLIGGATLVQGADVTTLGFTGTFSTPLSVTGISRVDHAVRDAATVPVTRLTVPGHSYSVGDVCKIVSDDPVVGRRQAGQQMGEYAVIADISGNDLFLPGLLRSFDGNYATNPRIARHERHTIHLDGVQFAAAANAFAAGFNSPFLTIAGAFRPTLRDVQGRGGFGPFINLIGCYAYRAHNVYAHNFYNDPVNGRYGYGIDDIASEYGVVTGLHGENVRHLYTTGGATTSANDSRIYRYGRTAYTLVTDSTCQLGTNTAFDTHEDCYGITFLGCVARDCNPANQDSAGGGFSGRGQRVRFINCAVYDSSVGFELVGMYPNGSNDYEIIDCYTEGITSDIIHAVGSADRVRRIKVRGGNFHGEGHFIGATNAEIDVRDVDVNLPFRSAGYDGAFRLDSVSLYLDEVRLNMADAPATGVGGIQVFLLDDVASPGGLKVDGRRLEVKVPTSGAMNFVVRGKTAPVDTTGKLALSNLRLSTTVSLTVGTTGTHGLLWTAEDTGATNNPIAYPTAYVRKTSTTTITASTTLVSVSAFSLPMVASSIYRFEMQVVYSSPEAADVKLQLSVPSGAAATWSAVGPGGTYERLSQVNTAVLDGAGVGSDRIATLRGFVTVGATAGNLALLAAQSVADAGNTVITTQTAMTLQRVA